MLAILWQNIGAFTSDSSSLFNVHYTGKIEYSKIFWIYNSIILMFLISYCFEHTLKIICLWLKNYTTNYTPNTSKSIKIWCNLRILIDQKKSCSIFDMSTLIIKSSLEIETYIYHPHFHTKYYKPYIDVIKTSSSYCQPVHTT